MNRLKQSINTYRQERHQRKQDALIDYAHNPSPRPLDDLKTDDKEILGEHSDAFFRDRYRRKTDSIVEKIGKAEDKKDIPTVRENFMSYRNNRAQVKIDRINAKIDSSSNSFLSRQINRQRRQTVNVLATKNKIRSHTIGKIEAKRKARPEELQKKIDNYVKEKVDAMYRKALRREMRRHDVGRLNPMKRAEFLAKVTPELRKQLTRQAILNVRKNNIKKGRLGMDYRVDNTLDTRKVGDYGRTIE